MNAYGKIAVAIVKEGTKGILLGAGLVVLSLMISGGKDAVKDVKLEDLL